MPAAGAAGETIETLDVQMLHAANPDQAAILADRLEALRLQALSPTTRLLLRRAQREAAGSGSRDALGDIDDAIELQPGVGLLWRERAAVKAMQGDGDGAVTDLGGALDRDPTDILAWSALSMIEAQRSQPSQAYEAWKHVLQLDPEIADGASRLAHLHRRMVGDPT